MIVQKSYIDNNGRLAIPIKIRQKLKLKIGDEVTIKYNRINSFNLSFKYRKSKKHFE